MKHSRQILATSSAPWGIEARPVQISAFLQEDGPPRIEILGLPQPAIHASRERVRAALRSSGYELPSQSVVITLAPADLPQDAHFFDLAIALTLLAVSGHLPQEALGGRLVCGELGLDGSVRSVRGGLAIAELADSLGLREVLVPEANVLEAAALDKVPIVGLRSLTDAVLHLTGAERPPQAPSVRLPAEPLFGEPDLSEVRGQEPAKRALEVAAAGGHNLLLVGPSGSGKTMLARRLPGLLPPLTPAEAVVVTKLYSLVAEVPPAGLLRQRPFRSPHSSTSYRGFTGGGSSPRPGEASLAHNGVLFLDELTDFRRDTLEVLRQTAEQGEVRLMRSQSQIAFPAQFSLVAATGPCACGHLGDPRYSCRCSPSLFEKYRARIMGPLFERIDLHVEVPAVSLRELRSSPGESSATVARRVAAAREVQRERFGPHAVTPWNAAMGTEVLHRFCVLDPAGRALMEAAFEKLRLSARALDSTLKVARTIADLAGSDSIRAAHVAEALQYRTLDRARSR